MKKIITLTLLLGLSAPLAAQQTAHISDTVYVFTHGGPGNQYRINGRVNSGEAVTVLNRSNQYVEIRTEGGRTGWVPAEFVSAGESLQARLPALKTTLEENEATISSQQREIAQLQQHVEQLSSGNRDYAQEVESLQAQMRRLQSEIDNMDQSNQIRWLTNGGLIALGGVILGLLIPHFPKRRKRRDEWF